MVDGFRRRWTPSGLAGLACLGLACSGSAPGEAPLPVAADIGEPLPELTPDEQARFEAGRVVFRRAFTAEDGLGPRFNENACNACHTVPVDGGTGETNVSRATRRTPDGRCDLLPAHSGANLRRQVTADARALGAAPVRRVDGATESAVFTIPFVFGLGLVDAIPLATLEALADPDDANGDGISGRVGVDASGRPARFGRKAHSATLAEFVDEAFRMEMGLTTPLDPAESRAGEVPPVPDGADPAPDPEVDEATFDRTVDFLRFLAPPAPAADDDPAFAEGRALFTSLGCVDCHRPVLQAGRSDSDAIADQRIALFSDLLLHDMGPGLSGTCGPGADEAEYRTEPLLGLRYRSVYLHDGRATRLIDAILMHGGEARRTRDAFAALDRVTQEALLRYLRTL